MTVRPLPSALQSLAEKEINEVPGRNEEDLGHLKEWLAKQPHLKSRPDDQWLIAFLRCCKHSLQLTKTKLDFFYTTISLTPEFFANRDPFSPDIQTLLRCGVFVPLPNTDGLAGPRVFLVKGDPDVVNPAVITRGVTMIAEMLLMEDDNFVIAGQQVLVDCKEFPLKFIMNLTPAILKKWMLLIQTAYPTRVKGIHFINVPSFVMPLVRILINFASIKIAQRIHVYDGDDFCELNKCIPLSILPNEYGGEAGSLEDIISQVKKKVESYSEWYKEGGQYFSDETKRPGRPLTAADLFGVEGSFRRLEID